MFRITTHVPRSVDTFSDSGVVLIADGDPASRDTLKLAFRMWGYTPYVAQDGDEAAALFRKVAPSVVVCDFWLDRLGGLALLRYMKSVDPDVLVVFVTNCRSLNDAKAAMRLGAADFLTKPPDYMRLKSLLDNVVAPRPVGVRATTSIMH